MKFIKEWSQFLAEENFISDYNFNLDYDDEGNVVLYHVSPTQDIEELVRKILVLVRFPVKIIIKSEYRQKNYIQL
ncbi:MAG: hypothetical protein ACXACY_31420 [Candidatus Hodarchaeales archaeon]|jgi:hypothetical protein